MKTRGDILSYNVRRVVNPWDVEQSWAGELPCRQGGRAEWCPLQVGMSPGHGPPALTFLLPHPLLTPVQGWFLEKFDPHSMVSTVPLQAPGEFYKQGVGSCSQETCDQRDGKDTPAPPPPASTRWPARLVPLADFAPGKHSSTGSCLEMSTWHRQLELSCAL